jgi:hypothetical protein
VPASSPTDPVAGDLDTSAWSSRRAQIKVGPLMLRVLIDADNVVPQRIRPVLDLLTELGTPVRVTVSGSQAALDRTDWPAGSELLAHAGWQQADLALAAAYSPSADPLLLITGDGDFGLLASRHPGEVLVVSGAASNRLRDGTLVVDPAAEGTNRIRNWLAAYAAE